MLDQAHEACSEVREGVMTKLLPVLLLLASGCQSLVIVRGANRNTDAVAVEVDWTTTTPPQPAVLQAAKEQIEAACDPAVAVHFILDEDLSTKARNEWSSFQLQALALVHRNKVDGGFYMLWANGTKAGNPAAGGASWGKRSFAMFPEIFVNAALLRTSIAHEMFHNFGLVDKYLEPQSPHHTGDHHCTTPNCVMQPQTMAGGILPYYLCPHCIADLEVGEEK